MTLTKSDFTLCTDHFVLNVAQPENGPLGLTILNRDPRKQIHKPDAYVGIVEDVGPRCRYVQPGDKVVVERWEYNQWDMDDERLVVREREILILDKSNPAPGVIVVQLEKPPVRSNLIIPEPRYKPPSKYYFGRLIAPQEFCLPDDETIKRDDLVWILKLEDHQFLLRADCLVFRAGVAPESILAKMEPKVELQVV